MGGNQSFIGVLFTATAEAGGGCNRVACGRHRRRVAREGGIVPPRYTPSLKESTGTSLLEICNTNIPEGFGRTGRVYT